MKQSKRVMVILCVLMLALISMAGCGKKEAKNVDYMTWTSAEWDKASDAEKTECAKAYSSVVAIAAGIDEAEVKSKMDSATEDELSQLVAALNVLFATQKEMNLQQIIDMSTDVANVMGQ